MAASRARHAVGVIGGATIIASGLGYLLILAAARWLEPADYAHFLTVWGVIFGVGSALSVVEQEIARQSAQASFGGRPLGRPALQVTGVGLALAVIVVLALLLTPLRSVLLMGDGAVLAIVLVATTGFALLLAVRGILIGQERALLYSVVLITEAASRIIAAVAVGILITSDRLVPMIGAVAVGSFAWIVVAPRLRGAIDVHEERASITPIIRRMLLLSAAAGLAACLLTGYPAVVTAITKADPAAVATLFAVVSATRIPLLLMAPIQALAVPTTTQLANAGDTSRLRALLRRTVVIALGAAAVGAAIGWLIGPWAIRILFGSQYVADGWMVATLLAATAVLGAGQLAAAALLALTRYVAVMASWLSGALTTGVLLAVVPGGVDVRGVTALAVGSVVVFSVAVLRLWSGTASTGVGRTEPGVGSDQEPVG